MASISNKNAHPEPVSTMSSKGLEIPQSRKGLSLEEAKSFVDRVMAIFRALEDMSDLKSMYETGKQLSRLYFDCPTHRTELAEHLNVLHDFPAYASKMMKKLNNMGVFKNDDIWFSSFYFYNITWNFSDCSPAFATALGSAGLPNLLNLNIGHQPYLDNLASKNVYYLMKASLSLMHNIARVPGNAHFFADESVKKSLVYLAQREEEFLRCVATLTLAYVVGESETDLLLGGTGGADAIGKISGYIRQAMRAEKKRYHGFTVEELVAALAALTVNDSTKKAVMAGGGIALLKEVCSGSGNPLELEYACRTLWNMAFDKDVIAKMVGEYQTVPILEKLKGHECAPVSKVAEGALWVIAEQSKRLTAAQQPDYVTPSPSGPLKDYIFLSYCWSNRDVMLKVRERLKEAGQPVWIDVEQLQASVTMEAVANSIEMAKAVAVCVSEPYKTSPNCRTEAQFAAALGKPIIPIVMQTKYRPDGWLATVLGGSGPSGGGGMWFDVSGKRGFDAAMELLIARAKELLFVEPEPEPQPEPEPEPEPEPPLPPPPPPEQMVMEDQEVPLSPVTANHKPESPSGDGPTVNSYDDTGGSTPPSGHILDRSKSAERERSPHKVRGIAVGPPLDPKVADWSSQEVQRWLDRCSLADLKTSMAGVNGRMLREMAEMRSEAPEFFFRSLETKLGLAFLDILKLSDAMRQLSTL